MADDRPAPSATAATSPTSPVDREAPRRRLDRALLLNGLALLLLLVGFGVALLAVVRGEAGIGRRDFTIPGATPVPVLHLTPAVRRGDAIAVLVHGSPANKETMIGLGAGLARIGVPSFLLDLPGYGESPVRFAGDELARSETALAETLAYARATADVPAPRLVVVGDSFGTDVVGTFALEQPPRALAATILISPVLASLPTPSRPANLLVVVGQDDLPEIIPLAPHLVAAACGGSLPPGGACGDPATGTGRRLVIIAGANHLSIVSDPTTWLAVDAWVAALDGLPTPGAASVATQNVHWSLFGVACVVLALFPLLTLLAALAGLRAPHRPPGVPPAAERSSASAGPTARPAGLAWPQLFGLTALATAGGAAAVELWIVVANWAAAPATLATPLSWIGLLLGDLAGSLLLGAAGALALTSLIARRRLPWPDVRHPLRQVAVGVAAAVFLYLTISAISSLTLLRLWLDPARLGRAVPLALAALAFFVLAEGPIAAAFPAGGARALVARWWLAATASVALMLLFAVAVGPDVGASLALSQLLLFLLLAVVTTRWRALGRDTALAGAVCAALVFAWIAAALLPITSAWIVAAILPLIT